MLVLANDWYPPFYSLRTVTPAQLVYFIPHRDPIYFLRLGSCTVSEENKSGHCIYATSLSDRSNRWLSRTNKAHRQNSISTRTTNISSVPSQKVCFFWPTISCWFKFIYQLKYRLAIFVVFLLTITVLQHCIPDIRWLFNVRRDRGTWSNIRRWFGRCDET